MQEAVGMTEPMEITTERADDPPLVLAHSDTMGVPDLLDESFKPHGNGEGMSLGWTDDSQLGDAHRVGRGSSQESGTRLGKPSASDAVDMSRAAGT